MYFTVKLGVWDNSLKKRKLQHPYIWLIHLHIGAGCQELSGARIPHNQQNGTRQALLDMLCVVSAESIGCKITLNITVFTGPKKWIDDIQYWHISPSFYEVHTKEQGDVSYRDDEASWGDSAQSRHCQHLLKCVWQKKLLSQQSQIQTFALKDAGALELYEFEQIKYFTY